MLNRLMQNRLEKSDNINLFLDAIDEFISRPKFKDTKFEVYTSALKVYLQIPNAVNSILYLINENNFEFDYIISEPKISEELAVCKLNFYIENDAIGRVLQNGQTYIFPNIEESDEKYDCMILPLIANSGYIGIVLVKLVGNNDQISKLLLRLANHHSSNFAGVIERFLLNDKINLTKSELEQRIASKTIELELKNIEIKSILDSVQTGILVVDSSNFKIISVNYSASKLLNLSEFEIKNHFVNEFIENYNESNVFAHESSLKSINSEEIPILLKISFINLGNKNFKVFSFVDISIRKNAEKQLKLLNENLELVIQERTLELKLLVKQLENEIIERKSAEAEIRRMLDLEKQLNEMKSKFVTTVSHEFRTPLTVIKSSAQFVDNFYHKLSYEDKKNYLHRISNTVDYITNLLENILFMEKSENNVIPIKYTEFDLTRFIYDIADELNVALKLYRKIQINNLLNKNKIYTDKHLLRLIFTNLISNAFKYSENESLVTIYANYNDGKIQITIIDQGIGIDKSEIESVFEIFYRANNVSNYQGTGLGLAVVKDCLSKLNGRIEIESELNKGTSVKIYLNEILNE